nr:tetratricopeptide repeat protein [Actinokineospora diospyrosa]
MSGSGGHGKTQLAAGLAEDQWLTGELGLLAWITASSRDGLVSAYADLAHRLTGDDMPTDRAVRWALGWLGETTTAWLVVLDDVRDPRDLDGLWPPPNGRVLVTTRRQDSELVGHGRRRVPVDLFTPEESRTCLSAHLDPPLMFGAEELASALGHLPLAVGHAGAYMADRNLTCAQYLTRWRTKPLRELFPAHTWQLSIELANSLEPAGLAAPLLHIAAVLDPRGIPITALTSQPVLDDLSTTREDAWDALGCLNRLSLITFDDKTIRLHPVVQRATWEQAGPKQSAAQVAADALAAAWPASDDPLAATFRDNTAFLTKRTGSSLWRNGVHSVLFKAGNSLGEAGHPADAQAYFATLFTKVDRSHSSGLTIRHNIAYWRAAAGDLVTALTELESVLADQVREIGREHPSTLNTRHNIAQFRAEAGERAAGLTELEAVLADLIRTRGPHHPATEKTRAAITKWRFRAE